jgi:uncharacterized protein YcbK (DUF882 family)|tara:strand:+ start:932 stop:1279 length:348 start_codon:yes stop_codon:yes gene_type:complete
MTYKFFTEEEFVCQETGENKIVPEFIERLDELREACAFPFHITSGYRSPEHTLEKAKVKPGTHAQGIAADIHVENGIERRKVVEEALKLNFGGIGVAKTFVHVDIRTTGPVMWTY